MNTDPNSWLNDNTSHVSTDGETRPDTSRYVLTIEEAAHLFAEAGVPRAPRSITRFCALGDLDCLRVETEKNFKYLIDQNSVEKRIKQLQQVVRSANKSYPDMSRHVEPISETQLDMSGHGKQERETEQPEGEGNQLHGRVEELENEIIHLKIDKAAKEQVINMMNSERKEFITQLNSMSFQLGEAIAKLQQLEAPRPEPDTRHVQTTGETGSREAEVVMNEAAPAQPQPAAAMTPAPAAPEKKNGFFSRLFNLR